MWDSFEEFNNGGFLVHRSHQGVKIRIVLAGLRGDETISVLYRREGISESLYYSWSEEFFEAGNAVCLATWPGCPSPDLLETQSA